MTIKYGTRVNTSDGEGYSSMLSEPTLTNYHADSLLAPSG